MLTGDAKISSHTSLHGRIKNLNITRCKIIGSEYILLSFEAVAGNTKDQRDYNFDIRNFTVYLKEKTNALQIAADMLSLQKGHIVSDDDLALASVIKSEIKSINRLTNNLNLPHKSGAESSNMADDSDSIMVAASISSETENYHDK
jgi:hypothetical protein